ncbi:hypothetical protein J120_00800 [candidate division TM6 bacterium JCVI TM6SC1]|uniref:Uncharacterized protein n=1 Tax=candidate division TM6 bacterium JCVI TM6SC1 TaxID=1306947 RepID=A0A0D2GQ30_9BACT|nr:hypothetical protein J120_00800 [candidate division TM6 bacterium JCVI TM6SC1]
MHRISILSIILGGLSIHAAPFLVNRTPGFNSARILTTWLDEYTGRNQDTRANICATIIADKSFEPHTLTRSLFEFSHQNCTLEREYIKISGSAVGTRDTQTDWLADYFGLPLDFQSVLSFAPHVRTVGVILSNYIHLDRFVCNSYITVQLPLVHTTWNLDFQEHIINKGTQGYPVGYFGPTAVARQNLLNSATDFFQEGKAPTLSESVVFQPLSAGRFYNKSQSKGGLSELRVTCGWTPILCSDYHLGFEFIAAVPTGSKVRGIYLFEPILGNGHFGEVGLGLHGHATFWRNCNETMSWSLVGYMMMTSLLSTIQQSSFDLKNQFNNSKYMLAQNMGAPIRQNLTGQSGGVLVAPVVQFRDLYAPVANITYCNVRTHVGSQWDITALLDFEHDCLRFDIGYSYYHRDCQRFRFPCQTEVLTGVNVITPLTWALKGDSYSYGFVQDTPIPLSATQSGATITTGLNYQTPNSPDGALNIAIDRPAPAFSGDTDVTTSPTSFDQINTSIQPITLVTNDINLRGSQTKAATNKFFGAFRYYVPTCRTWQPYVTLAGAVELGTSSDHMCDSQICCSYTSISQWSVWAVFGAIF